MSRLTPHRTGIIGGSGLYHIDGIEVLDTLTIDTPYGAPSDELVLARIGNQEIVFLPRHGRNHSIPPHKINYRANIYAMKLAGVNRLISISAVGSLRKHIHPGEFVLVDQFVDRTHGRESTFFDGPIVAHVSMADPVCNELREELATACRKADITTHQGGRYLVMQGPQFSSRAESELYRSWGMDVIGMTNLPEAKLAREAEICYATVAMCTDYDCWHGQEEDVSVQSIVEVMQQNVTRAKAMLHAFFAGYQQSTCHCGCREALEQGIFADLSSLDDDAIRPVHALVARLL
ncbi:S-methyl-5'-thioadenosine phosphorylase [Mariprofundus erugo]|uniref:S-methyl-5'-thioadenosine phosphorylase n=1 Tax=Mariprofundus erugo TaxID=2528639 RepID=A0A5R9GRT7_9PROT|nr:S-methyl-5'-thioadenosine phosphorylase [Mariprofundus erugo]TLS67619.1 S-methyl-5'-thioadenosine phosphorylase [Mariprofundus erugo]TLS74790.1 S-methyl-5'-thioadenosine phosphorylase [Mariprofundus erugo]